MRIVLINLAVLASAFLSAGSLQADEIKCASARDQSLYFSTGQVRATAEVNSPILLSNLQISTTGSDVLGANESEVKGKVSGNWVRFYAADAWCHYTLTLPRFFMTQETFPLFLDAGCEEQTKYEVRLKCRID
jgi:hypothetical protein